MVSFFEGFVCEAVGAADEKCYFAAFVVALVAYEVCERFGGHLFSAEVECDDGMIFGNFLLEFSVFGGLVGCFDRGGFEITKRTEPFEEFVLDYGVRLFFGLPDLENVDFHNRILAFLHTPG